MIRTPSAGWATAAAAAAILSAAISREVRTGRQFSDALETSAPSDMPAEGLRLSSSALQRHLKQNPRDLLAASLLNDIDAEIIRRS